MKLYKFRPLTNIERLLDIVLEERLYCAHFEDLNDPFEGVYLSRHHMPGWLGSAGTTVVRRKSVAALRGFEQVSRVCSLSASFADLRLWAHYADGHKGVAVEIDFTGHEADLFPIEYLTELPQHADQTVLGTPFADQILTKKTIHWEYENEHRILQSQPYYSVEGRVTAVLLGSRIDQKLKSLLSKAFGENVCLLETFINEQTLAIEIPSQDDA